MSGFVVAVTGSRYWTDVETVRLALRYIPRGSTILHGACRGLDEIAATEAGRLGLSVIPFPARWKDHGKAAGPIRNRAMLDDKPNLVLAFNDDLERSAGTRDMVLEASVRSVPVVLIRSRPPAPPNAPIQESLSSETREETP